LPDDTPDLRLRGPDPSVTTRTRGRRGRWTVGVLTALVLAGTGAAIWFWPDWRQPERNRRGRPDVTPVLVASAATRDVPVWLDALGTVQALNTVTIKPMVDGPLLEVRFREGQDVRAGDVLARIDPRPYQAALDQAEARKAQNEALLANARNDLARYTKLAQNNFTSAQQADTARAQVAQLEAQVRQDQAQIDAARTQLSYTTIIAPVAGRAGLRLVDVGNIVRPGDANGLVVITTLQPINVLFTLPQQQLQAVSAALRGPSPPEVEALADLPNGGAQVLDRGHLAVLDNQVDPSTGTIKLKAEFPNAERLLWPGGFVHVRLRVATLRDALTVPPAAIQRGPRGSFVYVLKPDNTVTRAMVRVSHEDPEVAVITEGAHPGNRVVTEGAARLAEGARVRVVPSEPAAAPSSGVPEAAPPGARRRGNRPADSTQ